MIDCTSVEAADPRTRQVTMAQAPSNAHPGVGAAISDRQAEVDAQFGLSTSLWNLKPASAGLGQKQFAAYIGIVVGNDDPHAGSDIAKAIAELGPRQLTPESTTAHDAPASRRGSSDASMAQALKANFRDNPLWVSLERVHVNGAKVAIVNDTCAWDPSFRSAMNSSMKDMQVVHKVDAALRGVLQPAIKAKVQSGRSVNVGHLGATCTIDKKVFETRWATLGVKGAGALRFVPPDPDVQKSKVMPAIDAMNRGDVTSAQTLLEEAMDHLLARGAEIILVSHTQLERALPLATASEIPVVRANKAVAKAAFEASKRREEIESENKSAAPLTIANIPSGSICIFSEANPASPHYQQAQFWQNTPHNGLSHEENTGSPDNLRTVIAVRDPANPAEVRFVGMSGGESGRIQRAELRGGTWRVYAPTNSHSGELVSDDLWIKTDPKTGGNIVFSLNERNSSCLDGGAFSEKARSNAAEYAKGAFYPAPDWGLNPSNMHRFYWAGAICCTLPAKTYQAIAALEQQAQRFTELGDTGPLSELHTRDFTGFMALDASRLSVRTLQHWLKTGKNGDGTPQFRDMGSLTFANSLAGEAIAFEPYAHAPRALPPLEPTDPRSVDYAQLKKQRHKEWVLKSRL